MTRADLLIPRGETRGRYYAAAPLTLLSQAAIRAGRPPQDDYDPFVVAERKRQLALRLGDSA